MKLVKDDCSVHYFISVDEVEDYIRTDSCARYVVSDINSIADYADLVEMANYYSISLDVNEILYHSIIASLAG